MAIFNVTGIQMPVRPAGGNTDEMLRKANFATSVFPSTDMIVFSELAPFGPGIGFATETPELVEAPFQEFARKHEVWLCPGSYFVKMDGQVYNHTAVIDPDGNVAGRYSKMFPFLPFEEGVTGGSDFLVFDVPQVGRFGLSICYDIWFPETTRSLVGRGVEVLIHPVLTGTTDRDAEMSIARATATMFQCYVVDVNGLDAGGVGRSMVIDPVGRVIHQAGQAAEVFPVEIDLELVRRSRRTGSNGLGQPLKSFRDSPMTFSVYDPAHRSAYLDTLGSLEKRPKTTRHS